MVQAESFKGRYKDSRPVPVDWECRFITLTKLIVDKRFKVGPEAACGGEVANGGHNSSATAVVIVTKWGIAGHRLLRVTNPWAL